MPPARSIVAALVLVSVVAAILWTGVFDDLSVEALRTRIESYGTLAPLVFIGFVVAGLFVPGPELLLIGLGGAIFGAVEGFFYGWIAALIGTTVTFLLVRQAVGPFVHRDDRVRFRRLRAIDERLTQRVSRPSSSSASSSVWRRRSRGRSARPAFGGATTSSAPPSV